MKITSAEFIKSAVWPNQYPPASLPEIAFAGRSNVGKSSLIKETKNGQVLTACCPKPFFTTAIEQNKDIFAQREKVLCIICKRLHG